MTARRMGRDNAWWADFYLKIPGRRDVRVRRRSPIQTKKGAEEYERKIIEAELGSSTSRNTPAEPTVAEFATEFLTTYAAVNNRYSELESKEAILRVHLLPAFGRLRLSEVTPLLIEQYKAAKLAAQPPRAEGGEPEPPYSRKSVNNHLTVLRKMLTTAVEWERLDRAPKITWLQLPTQRFDFFDFEEAERLVAGADAGRWRAMVLLAVRTGLRLGELRALGWEDVDLTAGRLVVRQSITRERLGPPKNGKTREIPLAQSAVDALRALRHLRGPYVFCDEGGGFLTKGETKHPLYRACRRAELRRVGWHVLRHTFASHLAMRGVPMRTIQELMGHATVAMSMRYAHLSPDVGRSAVATLDTPVTRAPKAPGHPVGIASKAPAVRRTKTGR